MGYYTNFNGSVSFDKSPSIVDAKVIEEILDNIDIDWSEDGVTLEIGNGEPRTWYDWSKDLYKLIAFCETAGYKIVGEIECLGEENPDIWAIKVENNKVYSATASIIMNEFTEVKR